MLLGAASRWVDAAPWAPAWTGNVLSPWLVAAWLAGAVTRRPRAGALAGLLLLVVTVAVYLLLAADEATRLLPGLAALALVGGPLLGAAGGARNVSVVGGLLIAEGALLQLGDRDLGERALFAAEALAGVLLAFRAGGGIGAAMAVGMGAVLLGAVLIGAVVFGLRWG